MLHAEEIDRALTEQIKLRETGLSVQSYFENLGVCPECLKLVAAEWLEDNKAMFVAVGLQDGPTSMFDTLSLTSFICGFGLGHVIGSGVATS